MIMKDQKQASTHEGRGSTYINTEAYIGVALIRAAGKSGSFDEYNTLHCTNIEEYDLKKNTRVCF